MDISYLVLLVISFTLLLIGVFWVILRKIAKGTKVLELNESRISWEEVRCPKCQVPMEPGYSMAGRGVIWRKKGAKRPGTFSTINSVLENTLSINIRPALNISWRCPGCKLIILDYSKMVKINKR